MLKTKQIYSLLKCKTFVCILFLYLLCGVNLHAAAKDLTIATTADFSATLRALSQEFKNECQCEVKIVSASTGELSRKIREGANYDAFFAADMATPSRLVEEGHGLINSYMVYAVGVLTLVGEYNLGKSKRIAVANPELSPYGEAAMQYLDTVTYTRIIKEKVVHADNVAEAYQQATDGSASSAFVPLSFSGKQENTLPVKIIPKKTYSPIRQAAIILKKSPTAEAFFAFVKSAKARELIKSAGYGVDEPDAGE